MNKNYMISAIVGVTIFAVSVVIYNGSPEVSTSPEASRLLSKTIQANTPASTTFQNQMDVKIEKTLEEHKPASDKDLISNMKIRIQEMEAILNKPVEDLPEKLKQIENEQEEIKALIADVENEMDGSIVPIAHVTINEQDYPEQYKLQQQFQQLEQDMDEIVRNIR